MIKPAFVNTEITEIISLKEDFQMKKQEKNGKGARRCSEDSVRQLRCAQLL